MNDEIISMKCNVHSSLGLLFEAVFQMSFYLSLPLYFCCRSCLLNTLIKCLKGHKSKKEIVQTFVTKERFTFVQNVQGRSYFGEERQRRGGMGGSSLDARLEVGDF